MGKRKPALEFADSCSHNNEDLKPTRRSRRIGNMHPKQTEPSTVMDGDSDDDFVTLLPSKTAATTSGDNSLLQRSQRHQQRTELKHQQERQTLQRSAEELRQQEEDDIMRAIELSKLEMEAEQWGSESQGDWQSAFPLETREREGNSRLPQTPSKSVPNRSQAADAPSQEHLSEPSFQSSFKKHLLTACRGLKDYFGIKTDPTDSASSPSSVLSDDCEGETTPLKMVQSNTNDCNEWQDMMDSVDWGDPSLPTAVAGSERGTPDMNNDSVRGGGNESQKDDSSQHQNDTNICTRTSDRLRLRKRHICKGDEPQPEQQTKVRKMQTPPDPGSLDPLEESGEEEEEVNVVSDEEIMSGQGGQENHDSSQSRRHLEVYQLVDTRKPRWRKHPFYAPRNVSKTSYSRVIYQLLQAYCCRLRQAQMRIPNRISWGNPVVTGNCYSDTLVHRKRGSRACVFYAPSDSEDEGGPSVPGKAEGPLRGRLQKWRKKQVADTDDNADSDFEDCIPLGRRRAQGRSKLATQDVVEMLKQDGRCFEEDRADETLSPTLEQQHMETQDFATIAGDASKSAGSESDSSQPIVRPSPSPLSVHNPDDSKTSHDQTDSQSSLTDVFQASSSNETSSGTKMAASSTGQNSGTPHKGPSTKSSLGRRKGTNQESETGNEEDSFVEEILSSCIPKATSHFGENGLQRNHSETKRVTCLPDSQSLDRSMIRNTIASADNEEILHGQEEREDVTSLRETSSPTLGPQNSARTLGSSFEEQRYHFYKSVPALQRLKQFRGEVKREECVSDADSSLQDGSVQSFVELSRTDSSAKCSQQSENDLPVSHSKLDIKQGLNKQQRDGNGLKESVLKRQPSPCSDRQQSLANSRSALKPQEELTDGQSPKEDSSECHSCAKKLEPDESWDDVEDGPAQLEDEDYGGESNDYDKSENQDRDEMAWRQEEEEDSVQSIDEEDGTVRANVEKEQDAGLDTEMSEHADAGGDEMSNDTHQGETEEDDDVGCEEEEDIITVEDRDEDAVEDTRHSTMVGVECPLCSVDYPIDQIEAHASACYGPISPTQEGERVGGQKPVTDTRGASPTNNGGEGSAGPPRAAGHRDKTANEKANSRIVKGVAARIVQEHDPKGTIHHTQDSLMKRSDPDLDLDDDSSESFSESADQLDASLLQLVEDNKLQLRERKRVRVPDRPAKRPKLDTAGKRDETSRSKEETEVCFICNQQIPKTVYAEHVQEEIDRVEAENHTEDSAVPLGRALRRRTIASSRAAAGGESSREAENSIDQSVTASGMSPATSWDGDSQSSDDDDSSQTALEDAIFNPRVSQSPIKAFRPISKQPMSLIDFKNQFNSSGDTKWTGIAASSARGKSVRRGRGRGGRGGKMKQSKKRRRFLKK
ncbi:uncharacterized protein LOC110981273 isoform X2 [Acanthaster planci]|uniref:Uncharacterized protein LOC110981273 isoform X2 n=1 Tax=Acanthaster planci TaxID=133434 RepID=A0A8B7YMA0_ACAPL|nr:uncharacterized protein LOC110981273 isoform X2 [Acanthaster planci]